MSFSAVVRDAFEMGAGRFVLALTDVVDVPAVGDLVTVADGQGRIVDFVRRGKDGPVVSTTTCLTGRTVAPHGSVVVEWLIVPERTLLLERLEGTSDV